MEFVYAYAHLSSGVARQIGVSREICRRVVTQGEDR